MTYATLAGIAVMRGLIRAIDDPVRGHSLDGAFESPQNRSITWRHLLEQTSEWQGTLWGKPDTIDHNRDVGKSELGSAVKGQPRPLGRRGRSGSTTTSSREPRRGAGYRRTIGGVASRAPGRDLKGEGSS